MLAVYWGISLIAFIIGMIMLSDSGKDTETGKPGIETVALNETSAEGDGDESFYVMFYRDGDAVRGFGSYYLPDGTEMGIMLTR